MSNPILSKEQLVKCRMGKGKDTCAFIIAGTEGIQCIRMDIPISHLIFRQIKQDKITAKGEGGWEGCLWQDELNPSGGN